MEARARLGLIWDDIDLARGAIHVRAQLSRARRGTPARRVPTKTRTSMRQIPLSPQLEAMLREHHHGSAFKAGGDWVFQTRNGTPLSQRNVQRRALAHAATVAGLRGAGCSLRFHQYADIRVMPTSLRTPCNRRPCLLVGSA